MRRSTLIIRDALFVNSFILGILLVQYLVFYLPVGFFEEQSLIFFMFALLTGLSLIGGVFYRRRAMAWGNALFLFVNFALAGYIILFFDGPFNILVLVLGIIMICLNVTGLYLNLRCLKSRVFAGDDFFVPSTWRQDRQRGAVKAIVVLGLIGFLGIASACSFWVSYTVQAPNGMQTKSSYWGPPSLTLATYTGRIYPDSNTTLWISNSTLDPNLLPPSYQNGTLAYVTNVSIPGS
ncbi:MAG TPA: hypothetical protein VKK79_19695, partial [Candidatus Lokiarchaeia archaeon]|nr:hypothetical protein [Candidatus Lokiarchaeia archaeon]